MSNLIQEELKLAKVKYKFYEDNGVRALCRENVAFVEAIIMNDSRYTNIYGEKSDTREKINKLKTSIETSSLQSIIEDINNQNSTHASKEEIKVLAKKIKEFNKDSGKLFNFLCEPDKDYSLIKLLSKKIKSNRGMRSNFSLATKICQTLCFVINDGNKYQDNFMKFDSVLRDNLPKYLRAYKITVEQVLNEYDEERNEFSIYKNNKKDKKDREEEIFLNWLYKDQKYPIYIRMINLLIEKAGNKISKNGLDHLIWYTNK